MPTCKQCGKFGSKVFCSNLCKNRFYFPLYYKHHPLIKKPKPEVKQKITKPKKIKAVKLCILCKEKPILLPTYRKFCSLQCKNNYIKLKDKKIKCCIACNKLLTITYKKFYCSPDCYLKLGGIN